MVEDSIWQNVIPIWTKVYFIRWWDSIVSEYASFWIWVIVWNYWYTNKKGFVLHDYDIQETLEHWTITIRCEQVWKTLECIVKQTVKKHILSYIPIS